jgi:hypothetical protein
MIRVCIEVDRGTPHSTTLFVKAQSISRALEVAEGRNPGYSLSVVFPLDPDTFFVRDASEGIETEVTEVAA